MLLFRYNLTMYIFDFIANNKAKCETKGHEFGMSEVILYLKCAQDVETCDADVFMKDVASIECEDVSVRARCRAIKVHQFQESSTRIVISVTKLIQLICKECPGILVQSVGATDVLIEKVQKDTYKGWKLWVKVALVCAVSFFGTAFTIIAYNNDVGVTEIFEELYRIVMDKEPAPVNILEITYSIGLAAGIIVFFNHIGGRRITKDPTPIEVSMRNYERDVNQALVETADRGGMEEDV